MPDHRLSVVGHYRGTLTTVNRTLEGGTIGQIITNIYASHDVYVFITSDDPNAGFWINDGLQRQVYFTDFGTLEFADTYRGQFFLDQDSLFYASSRNTWQTRMFEGVRVE